MKIFQLFNSCFLIDIRVNSRCVALKDDLRLLQLSISSNVVLAQEIGPSFLVKIIQSSQ